LAWAPLGSGPSGMRVTLPTLYPGALSWEHFYAFKLTDVE
jgi:hypothetical protein